MGENTQATKLSSTAMGDGTTASGNYSTAMGLTTTASGVNSLAIGREITSSGDYSVAIALNDQNGADLSDANTMSVMGGEVGIGTLSPSEVLEVSDGSQGVTFSPNEGVDSGPLINTTGSTNLTIASEGGSVIIVIG
jgi:hypothetical protein